jgi:hypothetical protein
MRVRSDDDFDSRFLGIGAAGTTDRRSLSKKEKEEISHRTPIGFVHFTEEKCPSIASSVTNQRKSTTRRANTGSGGAKRAGTASGRSKSKTKTRR